MFVRRKKNRSGTTSVVVVDKHGGKFKELHTVGVANDEQEVAALCEKGKKWIKSHLGILELNFESADSKALEEERATAVLENIDAILLNGAKLILDKVYDSIGFNRIDDSVLRNLVAARLCLPMSKMATVEYLKSHFDEDDLRAPGFSKDGKTAETQIILGLLVCENGYPLSYSIFNGAQYEGYTMIPMIDDFKQRFGLNDFVVVADSGFMIKRNISMLRSGGYKFIVGGRIRKVDNETAKWVMSLPHEDGQYHERVMDNGDRLIVSYSSKRAAKDALNRTKGVERLRKAFASGKITKDKINKRGYSKFLEIDKDVDVRICEEKIREDEKWDGLKEYVTNTSLPPDEVVAQYHGLWVVERAFRISKGTIETRPIFHFTEKRIEAHVCLCFVAYKVYKELERVIAELDLGMSVDTVMRIAKTITTIRIKLPLNDKVVTKTMMLTPEQLALKPLFNHLGI